LHFGAARCGALILPVRARAFNSPRGISEESALIREEAALTLRRWALCLPVLLAAIALSGCPSLGPRSELPPSIDRAQELQQRGDVAGAAHVYEELAQQNSGADRTAYALQAAHAWIAARRPDDAARALAMAQPPLTPQQTFDRQMLEVQVLLGRGQGTLALQRLNSIPPPRNSADAARYQSLQQQATLAASGQPSNGQLPPPPSTTAAAHLALLLPVTGRNGAAGIKVQEGFMTAFYEQPASERPQIRVYDTGGTSVAEAVTHATQEGADFIVGPLTKEEITAAAELAIRRPPILALNFLPPEKPAPAEFYQFALSPEDEARLVARRILADGHRAGVAFVPIGDWGTRVLGAFTQELQAGGGTLLGSAAIEPALTDYADSITRVLRISDSEVRRKRLESILGTKLQFEPRRRADIEFIFAAAQAPMERLLRPQLRYHFAGDIPTYATSEAFEPDPRANQDLEALMFPDMPWMLGSDLADAVREAARAAWPNGGVRRDRLFAFGFDAYRLAVALRSHPGMPAVSLDGLTGHLTLDRDGHVRRELSWAQVKNGEVHLLSAAVPAASAAAAPTVQ
jgi:outer membrane PBP1 activator LpoA protein